MPSEETVADVSMSPDPSSQLWVSERDFSRLERAVFVMRGLYAEFRRDPGTITWLLLLSPTSRPAGSMLDSAWALP